MSRVAEHISEVSDEKELENVPKELQARAFPPRLRRPGFWVGGGAGWGRLRPHTRVAARLILVFYVGRATQTSIRQRCLRRAPS